MNSKIVFRTFQKENSKKFNWGKLLNFLLVVNFIIIIGIYVVALFPQMFRMKDRLLQQNFTFIIGFIVLFLLRVFYYVFFKTKPKHVLGKLELSEDEIHLNGTTYSVTEMENLRFIGNDVKGDFRGYISKGTNNEIVFKLKNGEEISSHFEQTPENRLQNAQNLLSVYRAKGLLSEANFDNILNSTNYY